MTSTKRTTADARASGGPSWLVVSGESGVRPLPLPKKPRFVIGRASDCDVVVDEPSLSRMHLAISFDPLRVEDLDSRNGTWLLGRKLVAGACVEMPEGAVIEAGATQMMLHVKRPPASAMHLAPPPSVSGGPVLLAPAMIHLYGLLDVIAPTALPVMVYGETGSGKEVFADAIRARSTRASKPFLCVNCASLSGSLLESELFGHEKGAFTGALQAREGIFEAVHGGTLFLDEIGELPMDTQAKLLRVLENGEVMRLGSARARKVDVRFVAATHRDLHAAAAAGAFRRDLLFRLHGFAVTIPPLRAREVEIVPLVRHFLARFAKASGVRAPDLSEGAVRALERHAWPGNVRELRLAVERALALSRGGAIEPEHLMLMPAVPSVTAATTAIEASLPAATSLRASRGEYEKTQVVEALQRSNGNQTAAARALGISRRTLITKIETYGLARPRKG